MGCEKGVRHFGLRRFPVGKLDQQMLDLVLEGLVRGGGMNSFPQLPFERGVGKYGDSYLFFLKLGNCPRILN